MDDDLVLYHGTLSDRVQGITDTGLTPPAGVNGAGWPMLTTDYEQAVEYTSGRPGAVVLEYRVPQSQVWRRGNDGAVLWPGEPHTAYDRPGTGYGLRRPLGREFLRAVHEVGRTAAADDYRLRHRPAGPGYGAPMHDPEDMLPDVYDHPEYYFGSEPHLDWESHAAIRAARGNPDAPVTVYRALPASTRRPDGRYPLNTGDWVTPSLGYARWHGESNIEPREPFVVVRQTVPARMLWTEGSGMNEWGYGGDPRDADEVTGRHRQGATFWHVTDKPDFRLDPKRRPSNNTTWGGDLEPGVFVAPDAEPWLNGYGYWRPYVAEIEGPDDLDSLDGVVGGYKGERYVPARHYDKLRVRRVLPVDAYGREQFNAPGWVEDEAGVDFRTGDPLPPWLGGYHKPNWEGKYRYPGTAMDESAEWRKEYQKRVRGYQRRHPSTARVAGGSAARKVWRGLSLPPGTSDEQLADMLVREGPGDWWTNFEDAAQSYGSTVVEAVHPGDEHVADEHGGESGGWEFKFRPGTELEVRRVRRTRPHREVPWEPRRLTVAMPLPSEAHDDPQPFFDSPIKGSDYGPHAPGVWFHASPHDLPEGTRLAPSGGESPYAADPDKGPSFYEDAGWGGRRDWLWVENHPEFASGWSESGKRPFIYLVEPEDGPYPWNGTGQAGWVANGARVVKQISRDGRVPREYYDLYYDEAAKARGERTAAHDDPSRADIPGEDGWLYHGTHEYNAHDIADSGSLVPHPYDYGTDQGSWPDGGTEDRSYWTGDPAEARLFYPEGGRPVLLRAPGSAAPFARESTGDYFLREEVPAAALEAWTPTGWLPLREWAGGRTASRRRAITLYRGLEREFDPAWDRSLSEPSGYSHWTDNPDLAKQYAGERGRVYQIDLDDAAMGDSYIDDDGERPLYYDNDGNAALNGVKGREYLLYEDHEDYDPASVRPYLARLAALAEDTVDRLRGEFDDWWEQNGAAQPPNPYADRWPEEKQRGPLGYWPYVESFLADRYPAAHKGLSMGMEDAGMLLDHPDAGYFRSQTPYETGPAALEAHGYDPAEVAAAMVLLHTRTHPNRRGGPVEERDEARLLDVYRKRVRMQRQFDRRTAAGGKWYHVSPHKLPVGTVLTPGGGESPWGDEFYQAYPSRAGHVWMEPEARKSHWLDPYETPYWYEVQPEGEPQNRTDWEDMDLGWVAPSATVVADITPDWSDEQVRRSLGWTNVDPAVVERLTRDGVGRRQAGGPAPRLRFQHWTADNPPPWTMDLPGVTAHVEGQDEPIGRLSWRDGTPDSFREEMSGMDYGLSGIGEPVGSSPADADFDWPGAITYVEVEEPWRRRGVADALFDFARKVRPDLHHSTDLTDDGLAWSSHERKRKRRAARLASRWGARLAGSPLDFGGTVDRLDGEFRKWARGPQVASAPAVVDLVHYTPAHNVDSIMAGGFRAARGQAGYGAYFVPIGEGYPPLKDNAVAGDYGVAGNVAIRARFRPRKTLVMGPDNGDPGYEEYWQAAGVNYGRPDLPLAERGYDSAVYRDPWGGTQFIVFDPSQVEVLGLDGARQAGRRALREDAYDLDRRDPRVAMPTLYRGLTREFNPDFDEAGAMTPGASYWTDNPALARDYAGPDGRVYFYDVPDGEVSGSFADGGGSLCYENGPLARLDGEPATEYVLNHRHPGYDRARVRDVRDAARRDPHHGEGPWYHATNAEFAPGQVLLPGDTVGKAHGRFSDGMRVWVSNDPVRASAYGSRLYEVEPQSRPRSPYAGHDEHHTSGAAVLREVPADEVAGWRRSYDPAKGWKRGSARKWYHVSPHDLPVGTELVPGDDGGRLRAAPRSTTRGGLGYVWVAPDSSWHDRAPGLHWYEVDPVLEPVPYGGTGEAGWVTPKAVVRERLGSPWHARPGDPTYWVPTGDLQRHRQFDPSIDTPEDYWYSLHDTGGGRRLMPTDGFDTGGDEGSTEEELVEGFEAGDYMPPVEIVTNGFGAVLADGNHRVDVADTMSEPGMETYISFRGDDPDDDLYPALVDPDSPLGRTIDEVVQKHPFKPLRSAPAGRQPVWRRGPDGRWQRGLAAGGSPQVVDDDGYLAQMRALPDWPAGTFDDGLGRYWDVDFGDGPRPVHEDRLHVARRWAARGGPVTVYHGTTPEAAEAIVAGGFKPGWQGYAYFSTEPQVAASHGPAVVAVDLPADVYAKAECHPGSVDETVVMPPAQLAELGVRARLLDELPRRPLSDRAAWGFPKVWARGDDGSWREGVPGRGPQQIVDDGDYLRQLREVPDWPASTWDDGLGTYWDVDFGAGPVPVHQRRLHARRRTAMPQLHRGVGFRRGELPPDLEERLEAVLAGGAADPGLGGDLLGHLGRGGGGVGRYWALRPWVADLSGRQVQWQDGRDRRNAPSDYQVALGGDWDDEGHVQGEGIDPNYRLLAPGSPVDVGSVRVRRTPPGSWTKPNDEGWVELGGGSRVHARRAWG